MAMHGKRYRESVKQVDGQNQYHLAEAVEALKKLPKPRFDETVELALKLGVDPRQSDQMVRGTVALPHGSGKKATVVVFATGDSAKAAQEAGADVVGFEDLIKKCQGGWTDFDVAIATPQAMQEVRKLGKILGPKGLMPNPKTGTVTADPASAVKEVQAGRVEFRLDKGANLHFALGKLSFHTQAILENAKAVIAAIMNAKPAAAKGQYVRSCTLSSTMSPGMRIDTRELATMSE